MGAQLGGARWDALAHALQLRSPHRSRPASTRTTCHQACDWRGGRAGRAFRSSGAGLQSGSLKRDKARAEGNRTPAAPSERRPGWLGRGRLRRPSREGPAARRRAPARASRSAHAKGPLDVSWTCPSSTDVPAISRRNASTQTSQAARPLRAPCPLTTSRQSSAALGQLGNADAGDLRVGRPGSRARELPSRL